MGVVTALLLLVSWAPVVIAQENTQQPTTPPRRNPGRNIPTTPKPGATEPKEVKKAPVKPAPTPQPGQQPTKPTPQPSPQPPPSEQEDGQPVGRDETGRVKIDPEIQKKIDQMLQDKPGRNPNEPQAAPAPNPAQPPTAQPQLAPPNPGQPQPTTPAQRAAERRRATA
ncbi:MAG: hypothetical protein Q7R41_20265, partial [Phycisphaerales bacterium]|nr:hypothetical protein [Phycisphaerales bacterium]